MKSKSFSQTYRWLGRARTVAWFRNAFNVPNTSRGAKSNSNRERIRTQCNDRKLLEKNNTVVQNESNWSWNRHRSTLIPKKHCVIPWETVRAGKEIICITKTSHDFFHAFTFFPGYGLHMLCTTIFNGFWNSLIQVAQSKTFPENWDSKAPSVGTLLAYLETTA